MENNKSGAQESDSADKYFDPLQAACQTKYPKLIEIALEAIHYLLGKLWWMLLQLLLISFPLRTWVFKW